MCDNLYVDYKITFSPMYTNDIVMQLFCVYYNLSKSTDLTASVFILQIKLP